MGGVGGEGERATRGASIRGGCASCAASVSAPPRHARARRALACSRRARELGRVAGARGCTSRARRCQACLRCTRGRRWWSRDLRRYLGTGARGHFAIATTAFGPLRAFAFARSRRCSGGSAYCAELRSGFCGGGGHWRPFAKLLGQLLRHRRRCAERSNARDPPTGRVPRQFASLLSSLATHPSTAFTGRCRRHRRVAPWQLGPPQASRWPPGTSACAPRRPSVGPRRPCRPHRAMGPGAASECHASHPQVFNGRPEASGVRLRPVDRCQRPPAAAQQRAARRLTARAPASGSSPGQPGSSCTQPEQRRGGGACAVRTPQGAMGPGARPPAS